MFSCSFDRTADEVENPWCISSHDELLVFDNIIVLSFNLRDNLQRMNQMMWLSRSDNYSGYRGFDVL